MSTMEDSVVDAVLWVFEYILEQSLREHYKHSDKSDTSQDMYDRSVYFVLHTFMKNNYPSVFVQHVASMTMHF